MQLRTGYWMLAIVAVAGLIAADGTDAANVMMEAAHKKEVVDGDLNGAIKQYRAIVAKYAGNRAVSAMALVHMAECYQKMGDAESRKIYEQVLREYGDQKEAAATAQARLGGSSGPNPSVLSKRLLCTDCDDQEADFSPDGRLMMFTDWDVSGDLATRDMSSGKVKRLMVKPGTWKDSNAFVESPVLSRDLRQVVYTWHPGGEARHAQLRIMPNEPIGKARVLVDNPEYPYCFPMSWSADGKSVLVVVRKREKTRQLAVVSVADGAIIVLKSLDFRISGWNHPTFSPDGKYIVYHALAVNPSTDPSANDPKDQHIYVLATDGSVETEVVKTAGINEHPVWTPDGKHILFISDRLGKSDLWSIAVQNGKAVGSALMVSSEIGRVAAASMRGSSYYYEKIDLRGEYVSIADFAPGGSNQSRLAHATESFIGIRPTWSPDGKSIGFKRHHPGSTNEYDLVVHSLETGDERTYLTNLGTTGPGGPDWFHDGKTIETGVNGLICRFDLKTGESKAVPASSMPGWLTQTTPYVHSLDDKTIYASRNDPKDWDKRPGRLVAVDLSNGQEKLIFTMPEPGYVWCRLTPDGRTFVLRRQDQKTQTFHFYRLSIDGTGYHEIYSLAQKEFRDNFALTKDGRSILLAKRNNDDKRWQLIRIPIDGGAPESTGVELEETLYQRSIDLSPDGSRIAYSTSKSVGELWSLDNILSVLK